MVSRTLSTGWSSRSVLIDILAGVVATGHSDLPLKILGISGSIRGDSSNTAVLKAISLLKEDAAVTLYEAIDHLPFFNPDLDAEGRRPPHQVEELRSLIAVNGAVLISSPEYAHGVPGVLKNALDWLVSSPAFYQKPVGIVNISPRSTFVHESLSETANHVGASGI